MWGVMVTKIENHYASSAYSDEKIYDYMVVNLSTRDVAKTFGLEFICGVKIADEHVDLISTYASQLARRATKEKNIDVKRNWKNIREVSVQA